MSGSLVVSKLFFAALARQDTPESERLPHFLYADEIQHFVLGIDLPRLLAEASKYALHLILATQTLDQLPEASRTAVLGNCGTIASFRVGPNDADVLARKFGRTWPPERFQGLANHQLLLHTLNEGVPAGPYLLETFPPRATSGQDGRREQIIRVSLARYGQPRPMIESKLENILSPARRRVREQKEKSKSP